ncbi:18305_t:CDS:1, partial [Racocetra persica]
SGAEERDCEFIVWLRDSKKADVEWVLNNEKEFKDLRERYWSYGLCQKCQQPNNKYDWCQSCNCSGNPDVDQFIKKHQLK